MALVIGFHFFVVRLDEQGQVHQSLVDLTITRSFDQQQNLYNPKLGFAPFLSLPAKPEFPLLCNTPAFELPIEPQAQKPEPFLRVVDESYEAQQDDFSRMVSSVNEAVGQYPPELCEEGEGGTYFLRDMQGERVGVFKPTDEDPQADNNPKKKKSEDGTVTSPRVSRKSIPKGEAALREVAAFELDRGFSGVPVTRMMKATGFPLAAADGDARADKVGSLQLYIPHEDQSWNIPSYKFSTSDVHRIGVFDIRTFNTDRHGGNMLAVPRSEPKNGSFYDLVPIDHGFCFPTSLEEANWEWLYWPQSKKPFDAETLKLIEAIDVDEDGEILRRAGLSEVAIRVNKTATLLLKRGAAEGLNLFEIAKLCMRRRFKGTEEPSPLEVACQAVNDKSPSKVVASLVTPTSEANENTPNDDDVVDPSYWTKLQCELSEAVRKTRPRAATI